MISHEDMSRISLNWTNADLIKLQGVSPQSSYIVNFIIYFWRGIRTIKVIKCPPPNSSLQEDTNSNFIPNLEMTRTQTLTLQLQTGPTYRDAPAVDQN